MKQETIGGITASSLTFEGLEPHFRGKIREWMQALLIEEVTEFLGRGKSERKPVAEGKGYRNGYGKGRHRTTALGERSPVGQDGGPAEGAMAGGARGMDRPGPVGSGAGVPVGGWGVRESRAGEGEGGASGGHGGAVRREEGDSCGGSREPGGA